MIGSFEILYIALAFLVPGFIIDFCLKLFIPQRETSDSNRNILYYLCWSSINYGLWSWLLYLMFKWGYFIDHPVRTAVAGVVIVFISPFFVSLVVLICYKKGFPQMISRFLGLNIEHPAPTAWDYRFNSIKEKKWVIVEFDDGSRVGGKWDDKSCVSSIKGERDIYLEKVYKISPDDDQWETDPRNDGMWIKGSAIKLIQFINMKNEEEEKK